MNSLDTLNEYLHYATNELVLECGAKSGRRIERSNVFRVPLIPPFHNRAGN